MFRSVDDELSVLLSYLQAFLYSYMYWLLVATISFVLNTNIIFLILLSNTKVTGVGTNTEWGMLMANLSEDVGEETPLQVGLLPYGLHM